MRNRDSEWSYPMARFLGAFVIPPITGALVICLLGVFVGEIALGDFVLMWFGLTYGAVFYTTIPSIAYFLIIEKMYEDVERIRYSLWRFVSLGTGFGLVVGFLIGLGSWVFGVAGLIAGFATSYVIFPKEKTETAKGEANSE